MYLVGTITGVSGAIGMSGPASLVLNPATKAIYLMLGTTGLQFQLGTASGVFQGATNPPNSYGAPTCGANQGAVMPPGLAGPFRVVSNANNQAPVVCVYNPGMGTTWIRVFAAPT